VSSPSPARAIRKERRSLPSAVDAVPTFIWCTRVEALFSGGNDVAARMDHWSEVTGLFVTVVGGVAGIRDARKG
jgi:hypothetical protein